MIFVAQNVTRIIFKGSILGGACEGVLYVLKISLLKGYQWTLSALMSHLKSGGHSVGTLYRVY